MSEAETQIQQIRQAINKYYLALDQRQHGGVAQDKAFREIQDILDMYWVRGEAIQEHEGLSDE